MSHAPTSHAPTSHAPTSHAPSTICVTVVFFAKARELVSQPSLSLHVPRGSTPHHALRHSILPRFPALQPLLPHLILAVNHSYVTEPARALQPGDELALIPPISGG